MNPCGYQSTSKTIVKQHFESKHIKQYINSIKIQNSGDPASIFKNTKKAKSKPKKTNDQPVTDPLKTSYVCRFCHQHASHMLDLKNHLIAHLDAGEVTKEDLLRSLYGCKQCDYIASHQDNLELHTMLIHGGESPSTDPSMDTNQRVKEEECKEEPSSQVLINEQQESKPKFSNFRCALCDFRTKYEEDVRDHFETEHNDQNTLDEAV